MSLKKYPHLNSKKATPGPVGWVPSTHPRKKHRSQYLSAPAEVHEPAGAPTAEVILRENPAIDLHRSSRMDLEVGVNWKEVGRSDVETGIGRVSG